MFEKLDRNCPICESSEKSILHHQDFGVTGADNLITSYDVCRCSKCDFLFATGIPAQAAFNEYYALASKYEEPDLERPLNFYDQKRFSIISKEIQARFDLSKMSVLEIGCSNGGLLNELKTLGAKRTVGLDPSLACATYGQKKFNLDIQVGTIFNSPINEKFDLVICIGVIEHIVDLKDTFTSLKKYLNPKGQLWVEVPDASRFFEHAVTPFQDFSMEHIGFFGPGAAKNSYIQFGLKPLEVFQVPRQFSKTTVMPSVVIRGCIEEPNIPISKDPDTIDGINKYIKKSNEVFASANKKIEELLVSNEEVAAWGTGTQARVLFANTQLKNAKIKFFVDGNLKNQGTSFLNFPIMAPEVLKEFEGSILILSKTFQAEIETEIREKLKLSNKLIFVY